MDDLQLDEVKEEHNRTGKSIGEILNDFGLIENETQLEMIANYLGTEVIQLAQKELTPEILAAVPADTARNYKCLPVAVFESVHPAGAGQPAQPADWWTNWAFCCTRRSCRWWRTPRTSRRPSRRHYGDAQSSVSDVLKELGGDEDIAREVGRRRGLRSGADLANLADETPIIQFRQPGPFPSRADRASDIHFEPFEDEFKIRYRVDGALYEMAPPPKHLALPVISRIKVMANLDISERRMPQDGRIAITVNGRKD